MPNSTPEWVANSRTAAAQRKKVLAVEGRYDAAVLTEWLPKSLGAGWANRVYLTVAKNRKKLIDGLRWLQINNDPDKDVFFGLADRDWWETLHITDLQAELPTLLVNAGRHSIENYFCSPDDLDAILLARDASTGTPKYGAHLLALRTQIETARNDYVSHWALWCTVLRVCNRINSSEYPHHFHDICPLPLDAAIEAKIQEWAGYLDSTVVMPLFHQQRGDALALPPTEQFRSCVKSKEFFFTRVVVSGAHGLSSVDSKSAEDWMIELARWSPAMPADLEAILQPVLT